MRCPFCQSEDTQVKDSRPAEDGASIRRRRHCNACGARFTTFERVQLREMTVVKTDGRREPFDREKMARSIRLALRKRPVREEGIERIVASIQKQLEADGSDELSSREIGGIIMQRLKDLDPIAYIRFASVYENFRETKDFQALLQSLDG